MAVVAGVGIYTWLVGAAYGALAGERVVSYVCAMDVDVVSDKPGACPVCGMRLHPVRIETAWSCPVHAAVVADKPGRCALDRRELVPVTVNHSWTCEGGDDRVWPDPGTCADGRPRVEHRDVRAHGDHNPKHGGQFFMAPDGWHHVEGVLTSDRTFRLYLYDNFSRPLKTDGVAASVFQDGQPDTPIAVLQRSSRPGILEGRFARSVATPAKLTAKIRLRAGATEDRFDFVFDRPVALPPPVRTSTAVTARRAIPAAAASAPAVPAPPLRPAETLERDIANELPENVAEVIALMDLRRREVHKLIDDGNFSVVYLPTMTAKALALALADRVGELPAASRADALSATKRVVVTAWELDWSSDIGNREQIARAYDEFASAIGDVRNAYGVR